MDRKKEGRRERGKKGEKEEGSKVQGYGQLHSKFEAGRGWPESQKMKRKRQKGKSQKIPDTHLCAVIVWTLCGTFTCK